MRARDGASTYVQVQADVLKVFALLLPDSAKSSINSFAYMVQFECPPPPHGIPITEPAFIE